MSLLKRLIHKESFLTLLLILLGILAVLYPAEIKSYPSFIDWQTILALTGLLIITTGFRESGYFCSLSEKVLRKASRERRLTVFLVLLSAILSTFLTNDISLFLVIPLTISMKERIGKNFTRMIIFEAIAVNAGSALTPIGNPQNLFLWHQWNISFVAFMLRMLPLVVVLLGLLLLFVWTSFPSREFSPRREPPEEKPVQRSLLSLSVVMLIIYLVALETHQAQWVLPVILILYLILFRNVLIRTDWLLLFTFIIIFIDFHLLSTLPVVSRSVGALDLNISGNVYLLSAAVSQVISNVPASVFVSKFSHDWFAITYGVNVAGNGLVIGSLANIIALRMVQERKIWLTFHKYSLLYFLLSGTIIYVLFFVL